MSGQVCSPVKFLHLYLPRLKVVFLSLKELEGRSQLKCVGRELFSLLLILALLYKDLDLLEFVHVNIAPVRLIIQFAVDAFQESFLSPIPRSMNSGHRELGVKCPDGIPLIMNELIEEGPSDWQ